MFFISSSDSFFSWVFYLFAYTSPPYLLIMGALRHWNGGKNIFAQISRDDILLSFVEQRFFYESWLEKLDCELALEKLFYTFIGDMKLLYGKWEICSVRDKFIDPFSVYLDVSEEGLYKSDYSLSPSVFCRAIVLKEARSWLRYDVNLRIFGQFP